VRPKVPPKTDEILTLARWRKLNVHLQEAISEFETPSGPDLREHIIAQLPPKFQTKILKQEMEARKRQFWVSLTIPSSFDRAAVVENFVAEMGVERTPQIKGITIMFNCRSESARQIALGMDEFTTENLPGKIFVESMPSEFLSAIKIQLLVDEFLTDGDEIRLAGPMDSVVSKVGVQRGGGPNSWGVQPTGAWVYAVTDSEKTVAMPISPNFLRVRSTTGKGGGAHSTNYTPPRVFTPPTVVPWAPYSGSKGGQGGRVRRV